MFILVLHYAVWVKISYNTYPVLFIILYYQSKNYISNFSILLFKWRNAFCFGVFFFNTGFLPKFTCTLLGRLRDDEEVLEALALVLDELAFCFGGNAGAPLGPTLNSPRISWTSRLVLLVSCRSPLSSVEVRSVKIPV